MVQSACVVDAAAGDNEKDGTRSDDPALKTVPTYAIDTSRSPLERVDLKAYGLGADGAGVDVYKVALAAKLGDLYIGLDSACCDAVPGNGGLRVRQYRKPRDAVMDVVQLTRTMSMKHNMFNTGFAGAKLVVAAADAPECLDKRALMREVARSLALMRGRVYTGCDLNTSSDDMVYLDAISPYVLSGITNATLDTNVATAMGTFAAIVELAEHLQLADGFCVLVQGAGKVGATLASRLVAHGCRVRVTDLDPSRADIAGCENVSAAPTEWFRDANMDVFAPCAASGVIDERVAQELAPQCRAIVGSANVPFRTPQAAELCAARGVVFVPESITSAGAIIIDSVEWCLDKCSFAALRPNIAYHFVQNQIAAKTREFLSTKRLTNGDAVCADSGGPARATTDTSASIPALGTLPSVAASDGAADPASLRAVGRRLTPWLAQHARDVDVVIVGAGMAGTAAAYQLSKQDPEMNGVVLEMGDAVAHERSSSYGESRMFRQMYSDPYFSELQTTALRMWRELEAESGTKLLSENGLLFYGEPDTGETVEGSIPSAISMMQQRGISHDVLPNTAALYATCDGMTYAEQADMGVIEHEAGSVNSSLACEEMMRLAQESGRWQLELNCQVTDVWRDSDKAGSNGISGDENELYCILTHDGQIYRARKVVLCAGAWANDLLAHFDVQLDMEVWKVHWGHYKIQSEKQPRQWFFFGKEDALFYGFPKQGDHTPVGKVGVDFAPARDRMRSMSHFDYTPDESPGGVVAQIDAFVSERWGTLYGERQDMYTSPYAVTRDAMFVLDTLPGHPSVSLFTAGNGRAFKFAPLLGHALGCLVRGVPETEFDISRMAVSRPGLMTRLDTEAQPVENSIVDASDTSDSHVQPQEQQHHHHQHLGNGTVAKVCDEPPLTSAAFGRAHVPYGEVGEAIYSKLTLGCFDVVIKSMDLLESALRAMVGIGGEKELSLVSMVDFGSADGGPEMPMIQAIKALLPPTCELDVCFEDQPNNDFKSLFYLAAGLKPLPLGSTPLADIPGVYYTACGRGFFEQCRPAASVDLCTSYTAVHWLSRVPCLLDDAVHHTTTNSVEAKRAFRAQAEADWRLFLAHRAKELRPGGQMVIATLAQDPAGHCLGFNGKSGFKCMYEEMNSCWSEMKQSGRISQHEYEAATFPNYYRSTEELSAPFLDGSVGLKLKHLDWRYSECPYGRGKGSPAELIGTIRTWSNSVFLSALSDERCAEEKAALVDELYERYAQRIANDPSHHAMDYVHAYLLAEKV